jgi:hypothetical protein
MKNRFKLGDKSDVVWAGELVHECEFITYLPKGQMIWYDLQDQCFRKVYCELVDIKSLKASLNGWECANSISELLK